MKQRILLIIKFWLFFVTVFVLQKPVFMLLHPTTGLSFLNYLQVIRSGLTMDFATAGYLTVLPALLLTVSVFIRGKWIDSFLKIYSGIVIVLVSLIIVADINLFGHWNSHIDSTALFYLKSPSDATSSITFGMLFFCIIVVAGLSYLLIKGMKRYILNIAADLYPRGKKILQGATHLLLIGLLALAIRGGWGTSTMNVGHAYFSTNVFLNQSAVNPCFNLFYSLTHVNNIEYKYLKKEEAVKIAVSLTRPVNDVNTAQLLNTKRPNIVVIVLESFSGVVVEKLGGIKGITPRFDKMADEGIFFTNYYANGFRTDRGLLSILSGMPSLPTTTLLVHPEKLNHLPSISGSLKKHGYDIQFLYGGDVNFANMRQHFICSGFDKILSDESFPASASRSRWGLRDHELFNRLENEISTEPKQPFMKMALTLSSHEPFDVPFQKFEDRYLNAIAYTDSCLGHFIDDLKKSPAWKNTLVIMLPDHNALYPATLLNSSPKRFRIPMLWMGGAIKQPMRIDTLASQTDLAATLLGQMDIPAREFTFSHNFMQKNSPKYAFYTFSGGFGLVTPESQVSFDCNSNGIISGRGRNITKAKREGQALLQYLLYDFNRR
ncbi:LTA synthase family protein [Parabacteroides sp. FAFU027]|uniref:LTA synthase family protein n=1 Tax=Parabacteroides sp. FAFU027 TaxID=2922715 RepID=UPI001FAF8B21|nr:alkaline phosphatase family protein [Parabacteroides sp. FAFU027]